jgi:tetratricopeptide (TPR) repeat protein
LAQEPTPLQVTPVEGELMQEPGDEAPSLEELDRYARADELVRRGDRNRLVGLADQASMHYQRALELDRSNTHAYAGLAAIALSRRNGPEAKRNALQAVRFRPRRAAYHILLGDAMLLTGDRAGASSEWRLALDLEPNNRTAQQRLGQRR